MEKAKTLREIESLMDQAREKAVSLIESEARKIMKKYSMPTEFIMAMGSTFFLDKHGKVMEHWEYKYLEKFNEMVNDLDYDLHITGTPMRFTATGAVITDWKTRKE